MSRPYEGCCLVPLNRTVFAPTSGRLTIVINPKSACSTLKFNVWRQEYEMGATEWEPPKGRGGIHRPHNTAIAKARIAGLEAALFTKPVFSIVRNPYTRILSAYLNKIAGNKVEKRHLLVGMGYAENVPITFAEFVNFIFQQNSREMDVHYAPQTFLMQVNYIPYTSIGCVERIDESIQAILAAAYGITPVANRDFRPHRTDASSLIDEYFTDDIAAKLLDRYRVDFDTFGYSHDRADAHLPPQNLERAAQIGKALAESVFRPAIRAAVAEQAGELPKALDILATINADEPELDATRASILARLGQHKAAAALLQNAVKRADNVGRYWMLLSECLMTLGRRKDAVYAAERATSISPYRELLRRAVHVWETAGEMQRGAAYRAKLTVIDSITL